jgi:uncharacterized protein YegL
MNQNLTEIAYVLDRSGSMESLQEAAISGFNSFVKEQLKAPGEANLSLLLFDDEFLQICDRLPLKEVRGLNAKTYVPRGSTALLDAIGKTIKGLGKQLAKEPEESRPGKVIIAIYTDGYENASTEFTMEKINRMITHQRKKYSWDFIFLAANQDAIATAGEMGIDPNMSASVALNDEGTSASAFSIGRKIRSMRVKSSFDQEDADYHKSMSEIVQEEEVRRL